MHRLARLISLTAALLCLSGGTALAADGPVGADPTHNLPVNTLPSVCDQPTATACLNASIVFLNQARASLGQPPYALPANFDSLAPGIQEFVLANLDRTLYGLPPITGITSALSQDAMRGVQSDNDPQPTDTTFNYWTANWAGGFENVVLAYEAWMYDDGLGSGNLDCTVRSSAGCWGHRHDILWSFRGSGALAAGVAVANDPSGDPGYAMLLGEGDVGSYHPSYDYTWAQALAAGANGGAGASSGPGSGTGSGTPANPGGNPSSGATPPAPQQVVVTISVHGTGVVVDQSGQTCRTATCTFTEAPGHPIRLSARVAGRTTFAGWGGACSGVSPVCALTPGASAATVSAAFAGQAQVSRRIARSPHARTARLSRSPVHATVHVHRGRIELRIAAPAGLRLQCSLSARNGARFARDTFHACWNDTIYTKVPRGAYRLRIRTTAGVITRYVHSR